MRKMLTLIGVALTLAVGTVQASPVFVGSFNVYDGPVWTSNPQSLSAKQAAALIFGGTENDYIISVVDSNDPNTITGTAWLDGWGDTTYLTTPADDDYFLSSRGDGGYDQMPSFSAFVCDHANCADYGNAESSGIPGLNYTNYVWRVEPVPVPAAVWLFISGVMGLVSITRRREC